MAFATLDKEMIELLDEGGIAYFGTIAADGSPHAVVAGLVVDGNDLVTHTKPGAVRIRNLNRDPRINVLVVSTRDLRRYVQISGTATVREGNVDEIGPLFRAQNDKAGLPPAASELPPDIKVAQIRITPTKVMLFGGQRMGPAASQRRDVG